MKDRGEIYKVEHIDDLPEDAVITFYQQGDYIDMCVGPHLTYTKALKAFKLTALSGAYWKNDQKNKMLTRLNGVAFRNQDELKVRRALNREIRMMFARNGITIPFPQVTLSTREDTREDEENP